jgi:hypothetical protein
MPFVERRRRKGAFDRLGRLPAERLGLSARRTRELALADAWRRAAGEALSRRTQALRVERGVLLIRRLDDAPDWAGTLAALLPELGGRVAALRPEIGVKRIRLLDAAGRALGGPQPVRPVAEPEPAEERDRQPARSTPTVEQVRDRYLARAGAQEPEGNSSRNDTSVEISRPSASDTSTRTR